MNRIILLLLSFLIAGLSDLAAQEMTVKKAAFFDKTPPLREMKLIEPGARDRSWKDNVIRNETDPRLDRINRSKETKPIGPDPLWQKDMGSILTNEPIQNFEGTPNVNGVYPPDTDGDVGPDHYFQMINLSFQIFDKEGNSLYGPADNSTLWDDFIGPWTGTNDGDPILLYDEEADRWMASQFAINTDDGSYWELFAISKTPDPTGEYYRYAFEFPAFNDYPKIGVWHDAYYASFNMFGDYNRVAGAAFERDAMLEGDPDARMVLFDLPDDSEPWSMLPADFDGAEPATDRPNYFAYMVDDLFGGEDKIVFWEFDVDWDNTSNSTFEEAFSFNVSSFDSEICQAYRNRCIPQPETDVKLETLSDRLMFRLQYKDFGDYEVMLTNHTVDVDGTGHAGIRWYEFRDEGDGWTLRQEGTFAPDSDNRWMGSIAMNDQGIIALGYSVSSPNTYPSIRYTGRGPNSPLGEMVFVEESIIEGTGSQYGSAARWGDYSMMSVDPEDDETFWFTTEYVEQSGSVNWQTRIASFLLEEDFIPPEPVTDLAADTPTTNGVWLNWTATADNQGKTHEYDIRYDESPIDSLTWEEATAVSNTPSPNEPGQEQQFYISDLEFNQDYYFAMKVLDRQNNYSGLSNVVSTATPGLPDIAAQTDTIRKEIYNYDTETEEYLIANNGESDIRLSFTKTDNLTHNPGEDLRSYATGTSGILGVQSLEDKFYLVNNSSGTLLVYDTVSKQITDEFSIHEEPFGITYDGERLWVGSKNGEIIAYTKEGDSAGMSVSIGESGYHALAFSGEYFYVNKVNIENPPVKVIDMEGNVIDNLQTNLEFDIWQSTWVDRHQNGKLWITNNDGIISQLKLEEGVFTALQTFEAPATISYSLSHDGSDLVYTELSGVTHLVDDGVSEVNWLEISPVNDTVPAQEERTIDFIFKTDAMFPGSYSGTASIHSNDPDEALIDVPLELSIMDYDSLKASITSASPDTVCEGTAAQLSANVSEGTGSYDFSWYSSPEGFTSNEQEVSVYPVETTTYYVEVNDGVITAKDSVVLNVKPAPDISLGEDTTICKNHTLELALEEGYENYLWSEGSAGTSITIDSTNTQDGENTFWVEVEGNNGCITTDTLIVTREDCAGIQEFADASIKIFPNPTENNSQLVLNGRWESFRLTVMSSNGQEIVIKQIAGGNGTKQVLIDLSNEQSGTYYINLQTNNASVTRKLMKL